MPKIVPPGGEVDWPREEGALGVVGVAPWATLEFCRALYGAVAATKDWHFPRVLLDINTKLPSRGRHLQLGETDPSEAIAETIVELADMGATLAVVVCNTAHILYDRWGKNPPIPILHIIEETVAAAHAAGAAHVAPFVSASLADSDLYGAQADARDLACTRLAGGDQRAVNDFISAVKVAGGLNAEQRASATDLIARLKAARVDTVIAGCTELSVLEPLCTSAGVRFIDSNTALAHAALRRLHMPASLIVTARP